MSSSQMVKKIVIPIAGRGTRMYPATKLIPKAFLTIVDPEDGLCKPGLVYTLEKLYKAFSNMKIEDFEFILIISEEQKPFIDNYFNLTDQHEKIYSSKAELFAEFKLVRACISKIKYVIQKEQKGFGHALLSAKEEIGNEPFLLLFGDHVLHSTNPSSSAFYEKAILSAQKDLVDGFSTIFLQPTTIDEAPHYTLVTGSLQSPSGDQFTRLEVTSHVFKPSTEEIKSIDINHFFKLFGLFFFPGNKEIFEVLEKAFSSKKEGELDISDAFSELTTKKKLRGAVVGKQDAFSLDFGIPDTFAQTLKHLAEYCPK